MSHCPRNYANRCLQQFLKSGNVFAALMNAGILFHARGSACAKVQSTNDVVVLGIIQSPTAADRKRRCNRHESSAHLEQMTWNKFV